MITASDLIRIPYTPDLTEGGIAYAGRSLPHTYNRMGGSPFDRLRRIVAGVAVELAFQRYLAQQNIPFDIKGVTPFTDPDHYDVSLGGHRCDIKSFLISHRTQITALRADPELILKAPALVPLDQYSADGHSDSDLYLFAFLTGLVAALPEDSQKAVAANQPIYLIHTMPKSWTRPPSWISLGPLALKSESDEILEIEIGGQGAGRDFMMRKLELPPRVRVAVHDDFYSLAYIHAESKPNARLGIYSPTRRETYLIESIAWSNIWVYGMDVFLTGWIAREEFRRCASLIREGSRVFQYDQTRTKNLAVPVSGLRPMSELFEGVLGVKANGM
ncbi:MAG TPA: hypothetical protein VLX61_07925 [Anaerolineales bacterium]|nr:hypothetical protein [Anaerolineales bacterium]